MRKHFLLLFLMALLPLAGWAATIDVEVRPFDASVDWTGAKPEHVDPSWITCTPSVDATVKAAIANALTIQDLDSYNAGIHTYKLQKIYNSVTSGGDTYNLMVSGSYSAELTIEKFMGALAWGGTLAFVEDELVYTGEPQALLQTGATATANGFPVPVVYATSEDATTWVPLAQLKETNANTTGYTVYYKVVETDNYVGSNVLTMPGTKAIAKATITFNLSAATGLTYNGAPQALLTLTNPSKPATNFGASTLQYKIDDAEAWAELPEAGIAGITGTSAKNEVAYSINLKVPADENGNWDETVITAPIATTIAKATPIFTYVPTHENGGLPTGLGYDGQSHQLVLNEATAIVENTEISVPVKYSMRRYKNVSKGYTVWSDKTYDELVGTYASSQYQIKVKTDATDDLNQAIQSLENVAIAKATIPADAYTEPVAKNVRTTGALQPLVDAATWTGETTYGTFQYSLTNNGTDWSTDIPQGTDVAEYPVYWRIYPTVTSDTQNYDIVSGSVAAKIKDKSTVTIAAKANQTFGYGTTPVIDYTTVWTEQGSDELNVTGMVWNWYTNSDCSTPATVDGNGNFTVGDYFVKASGATVTGTTAASQEIVYTPVAVKITAGQVTASISATATYGSLPTFTLTHVSGLSPAEAENFNAANNLGVVTVKKGEEIILNGVANNSNDLKTLPQGTYTLEATASCGANYAVVVSAGTLTVSAKSIADAVITVTTAADDIVYNNKAWGTVNPIAFTVTEASGIDAADYDVAYSNNVNAGTATITLTGKRNYAGTKSVNFIIKKAALKITANNTNWTYGTTPEPTYAVTVTGQAEGETALAVDGTLAGIDGTLTVVRTSNATVGLHAGALVAKFGAAQPAASTNYNITYEAGDLTIGKAAATIQLKAAVAATLKSEYGVSNDDAKALIQTALRDINNYEAKSGITAAELASVNVGSVTCDLADQEYQVTQNYSFTATGATSTNYDVAIDLEGVYFTVTPAPITLYANDQAIDWSDTDPDNDAADTEVKAATVIIADGPLKYSDELSDVVAEIVIASQNVGTNNISLTAAENANYNIVVNSDGTNAKYGVLNVTGAPALALSTADTDLADKLTSYNGKAMPVTIDFSARNARTLPAGTARTWTANTWVTLTLPFDISVADLSKALGYAIVNVVDPSKTEVKGNETVIAAKLTMKGGNGKDDVLAANKPFLVKTADAITGIKDFGTQTIVAPGSDEDALSVNADKNGYVKLVGTYTTKTVTGGDNAKFWFMMGGNYNSWAYIGAGKNASWDVLPFEGYIDMSGVPAGARNMTFIFEELDGSTTAIKSVNVDDLNGKIAAEGMYNMNGMKLNTVPTQKGVYIMNGKKVVIK